MLVSYYSIIEKLTFQFAKIAKTAATAKGSTTGGLILSKFNALPAGKNHSVIRFWCAFHALF
jgi:hypothetical protein